MSKLKEEKEKYMWKISTILRIGFILKLLAFSFFFYKLAF